MDRMKKVISKILLIVFLFTSVFINCSTAFAKTLGSQNPKKEKVQLLVKYKDDSKSDEIKTKIKDKLKLQKLNLKKKYKSTKTEVLEIDSNDDINKVVSELKNDTDVAYAQVNQKLKTYDTPSDERYGEEWGLKNSGQAIQWIHGAPEIDINAENAWANTEGSPSVLVGVLDTGIDINHSDLKNNIYINSNEISGNGIDDDGNGYVDDINGWDFANGDSSVFDSTSSDTHGTHIAGIIAASADSYGIRGVAPNVKILPLKFIQDGEGYTSDAIDAIEYAKQMGVKIINCSFGGTEDNQALKDEMANSDILFVCAAGNNSSDLSLNPIYPAAFDLPNVLSVAAVDNTGALASFSNYGQIVDVAAPGASILSTTPDNTYNYMSGTSAAAAFVTGTAALVKSSSMDMTAAQIASRIKNSSKTLPQLQGKVKTNGMVDAAKALDNTVDSTDTNSSGSTDAGNSTTNDSMMVTLAVSVSSQLQEQIHYGEQGVNVSTGNYSKNCTDMGVIAPGFTINISRTYNSKDTRATSTMGRGWTFGFEGNLKQDTTNATLWVATLPNGAAQVFVSNSNGTFTANDSHSTLMKQPDGSYILTTKDQYTYGFNAAGFLSWMKDRNGNTISIQVDSNGKIDKIIDSAGRTYSVAYNNTTTKDRIISVTDPLGRTVQYQYDASNRLWKVTDPNNNVTAAYEYDSSNYLTTIKDYNLNITDLIAYDHASGTNKVQTYKDVYGNTSTYSYDTANRITTITDSAAPAPRVIKKWYDTAFYVIKSQDTEGKQTIVEYFTDANGVNKYGEEKTVTDRNGNKTQYERDNNGNITKITNPDGSFRQYTYDNKNNETMEKDETGKCIYSIYDAAGVNLIKKVQPLNGTDSYSDTVDQSNFAITFYSYYTDSEAAQLGYNAKGLLKSVTDPEGNTTVYTYDSYGNKKTVTDPDGNITTNFYNTIGWLTATVSPEGYRTDYSYDNNGRLIKTVLDKGETARIVYDQLGRKIQEIYPNQYDATKEISGTWGYSDINAGTRYAYNATGTIKSKTTAEKDPITQKYIETDYTYDMYGNIITETKPNGSIYIYDYDIMNRQIRVSLKKNSSDTAAVLNEYSYGVSPVVISSTLTNYLTTKTETKHLNSTDNAVTVTYYDFNGNLVKQQNPDGTVTANTYNLNGTIATKTDANGGTTYIKYDALNRVSETWSPIEAGLYSYSANTYYKNGNKKEEKLGKDKIVLYSVPSSDRLIVKTSTYYPGGKLKSVTDTSGGNITYKYDQDGFLSQKNIYTTTNIYNITDYVNNQLGKPVTQSIHVNAGDIYGNDFSSTTDQLLKTIFVYDKNGNLISETTPDGVTTNYTYDNQNRQLSTSKPGLDKNGLPVMITTSQTYNWADKILTSTDERNNTTTYTYDEKALLTQKQNPNLYSDPSIKGGISAYQYDNAGRKIAEVSPQNYDPAKTIDQMDRTIYNYDLMGRIETQTEVFHQLSIDPASFKWISTPVSIITKAYKYDNNGNVIKELDGEGYKYGVGTSVDDFINSGYGTEYQYNLANKVVTMLDSAVKERNLTYTVKYNYDGALRKISDTYADGTMNTYHYDDAGRILSTGIMASSGSAERTTKAYCYDLIGNVLSVTDGVGNITKYEYNSLNLKRKEIYPGDDTIAENTITNQYDAIGRLVEKQNTLGKVNLFTYDNQGRVLTTTEENQDSSSAVTTASAYDEAGNRISSTDGNGAVKHNKYDELNRLIETDVTVTDLSGNKSIQATKYVYDRNGNQISATGWNNNVTTSIYDTLNRLIEKDDANLKPIERLEYNASNVQVKSYDALNNLTQFSYDLDNRLTATIDPEGHVTKKSYDNKGKVASETDGNGNITSYVYDQLGRLISVTDAKGENTSLTYDLNGNKLTQTDGNGNTTMYEYNAANKLSKKIDAGGRTGSESSYTYNNNKVESYTYYADGNLATTLDRSGRTNNYTYDIHGNLLSKAIGDDKISYTYDNDGNQLMLIDSTGTTVRKYDELGRVISKSVPQIGTSTYLYDQITGLNPGCSAEVDTDAKGNVTKTVYDKVGRISEVWDGGNKVATYDYYDNGMQQDVIYPGTAKEVYVYYKNNLLKTLTNSKSDSTLISSYSYIYDSANNQIKKTDALGDTTYVYDELNRLSKVTEASGKITEYSYDSAGNRKIEKDTQASSTTTTSYTYNEQNRLTATVVVSSDGSKQTNSYSYDNNGNMTRKAMESTRKIDPSNPPQASFGMFIYGQPGYNPKIDNIVKGTAIFEYDVWNQMTKSITGDGTTTNQYNGEGLRVEKTANDKITKYVYNYNKVVLETDKNGNQTARNIQGNNLISRTVSVQTLSYLYNGHADVTSLVDSAGNIQGTYYYDAFGNLTQTTGTANNPYTYSGYQYDKESGLYYLNARMYDAATARFMQEDTYSGDPNDPLSLNLYTYCKNDPVMYSDPSGHYVDVEKGDPTFTMGDSLNRMKTTSSASITTALISKSIIETVQTALNIPEYHGLDYKPLQVDGIMGKNTSYAISCFQKNNGLTSTGSLDSTTLDKILNILKPTSPTINDKGSATPLANSNKATNDFTRQNSNQGMSNLNKYSSYLVAGNYPVISSNTVQELVKVENPAGYPILNNNPPQRNATSDAIVPKLVDATGVIIVTGVFLVVVNKLNRGQAIPIVNEADCVPEAEAGFSTAIDDGAEAASEVSATTEMVINPEYEADIGEYGDVGGHHIHAKSAFNGDINYDPDKGFSISQDYMKSRGWNHADMSTKQRQLFKELYESGRPNTLEEHTRIAKEALKAGGATEEEANELINKSLQNLEKQGVAKPTRIPWYSK